MRLPPADIDGLADALREAASEIVEGYEAAAPNASGEVAPGLLADAVTQLIEVLKRIDLERDAGPGPASGGAADAVGSGDVTQLGEYGFGLLGDLGTWAARLELEKPRRDLELLALSFALWLARHGGELRTLEPVVNAAATLANRTHDARELEALYAATGEVMEAAAPSVRQDLEKSEPGRPWRVLNLNRAIVATRTHSPRIMEEAFETLAHNLPEDAPAFFREGMGQMEALNYPPKVREVMERYYRQWCVQHTLH